MKRFGFADCETITAHGNRETLRSGNTVLKTFRGIEPVERERLRARGDALKQLRHPGLARCIGVYEEGDAIAFGYEWVEGESVGSLIDRGTIWSEGELFLCVRQCAEAMLSAHHSNPIVLHRDIKPDNVVWTGERFVIIDFDAAREFVDTDGNVSVIGTTGYAGPEQFIGRADPRSDQYGIATTVVHMSSGRHPTEFPLDKLRLDISAVAVSRGLREILERMLNPNSVDRFETMEHVLSAVDRGTTLTPVEHALSPLRELDTIVRHSMSQDADIFEIGFRFRKLNFAISMIIAIACGATLFFKFTQFAIMVAAWAAIYSYNEWSHRERTKIVIEDSGWKIERKKGWRNQLFQDRVDPVLTIPDAKNPNDVFSALVAIRAKLEFNEVKLNNGFLPVETRSLKNALEEAFRRRKKGGSETKD